MRGLTDQERGALEEREAVPWEVGQALLQRGLLELVEVTDEGFNLFRCTPEGRRALRFDWAARMAAA